MSSNIIPPNDAALVLSRLLTQRIPVVAWFVSKGGRIRCKVQGFVNSFTPDVGLVVTTPFSPGEKPIPAHLAVNHDLVAAATFRYNDETELPEDFEWGSGLRIDLPNGDTLTIVEIRTQLNASTSALN